MGGAQIQDRWLWTPGKESLQQSEGQTQERHLVAASFPCWMTLNTRHLVQDSASATAPNQIRNLSFWHLECRVAEISVLLVALKVSFSLYFLQAASKLYPSIQFSPAPSPQAVGRNFADSTAMLLSSALMLDHLILRTHAAMVRNAVYNVLFDGKMKDLVDIKETPGYKHKLILKGGFIATIDSTNLAMGIEVFLFVFCAS